MASVSLVLYRPRALAVQLHETQSLNTSFERLLDAMARAIRYLQLLNLATINYNSVLNKYSCALGETWHGSEEI